ncbi:MAG: TIGR02281 family clan AA aspartic protease [Qingshengfaniella sp.]
MSADDIVRLLYLGLLGAVVGGYFLISQRRNLGRMVQQALLWLFIFIGVAAAYGLWQDIRGKAPALQTVATDGAIIVPRARDGHYYLSLDIDGTPVRFMVDTGATDMVLSLPDANRIGIDTGGLHFLNQAQTANGVVATAMVRLGAVTLGPVTHRGVTALISAGEMPGSLLGMGYLSRFAAVTIANGRLTLMP